MSSAVIVSGVRDALSSGQSGGWGGAACVRQCLKPRSHRKLLWRRDHRRCGRSGCRPCGNGKKYLATGQGHASQPRHRTEGDPPGLTVSRGLFSGRQLTPQLRTFHPNFHRRVRVGPAAVARQLQLLKIAIDKRQLSLYTRH